MALIPSCAARTPCSAMSSALRISSVDCCGGGGVLGRSAKRAACAMFFEVSHARIADPSKHKHATITAAKAAQERDPVCMKDRNDCGPLCAIGASARAAGLGLFLCEQY